jgi:3-methylfumaryl-CoA hydratase
MPVDPDILSKAREYIGLSGPIRTTEISRRDIRRFVISIGEKDPLYRDPEYAKSWGYSDTIAPPMFHCAFNLPEEDLDSLEPSGLGESMGPRFEVPVPGFDGAVAGGRDLDFGEPIKPGDRITAQETVVDVYAKEGRSGPMVFIVSETNYTNQDGQLCVRELLTIIRHQ